MHLIETYALACGAKIDKSFIYEVFTPLPGSSFISFHAFTKFNSRNYDYWQDVLDIIVPVLNSHKIVVIQTGGPNDPRMNGVVDYRGKTTMNQLAYIVKRSKLHFGCDSFAIHLASAFDVPIVGIYNVMQPENSGPYFGNPDHQILFDCSKRLGQKPSYAADENPKTINTIFPEEIAAAILKLLKIPYEPKFKTIFIGDGYGKAQINDFVPNQAVNVADKNAVLDVRMDYHFNENALAQQLQNNKCRIFANKRINTKILSTFKPAIDSVYYFIEENDDPAFVKEMASMGIKVVLLCSLPQEVVDKKKINYYELGNINIIPNPSQEILERLKNIKNLQYKSCRTVHSKGKFYASREAEKLDIPKTAGFQPVIDTPDFWKEEFDSSFFVEPLDK